MAVAAYAAVVSLIDVLDQIQDPSRHRLHLDRKQIEALQEKVSFLQEFLELHYSQGISKEIEGLVRQIPDVANEADDIIDFHVVNQIHKGFPDDRGALVLFYEDIGRVMEKIDSIKGKLMAVKEGITVQEQQSRVYVPAVSTAPPPSSSGKNAMVGFDEHLVRVMDELTGYKSDLWILPIVGMGGIGKTTLARNVFDNPYIVHHYHVRLWVTISQEYSVRELLLGLLDGIGEHMKVKERKNKDSADLGEELYKNLSGRRYLIVMDDVWDIKVWNDLRMFFPDNKNGSRIMVTTRLSNVAASLGSNNAFLMDFLDEDQSWDLFCQKAFPKDGCPPELENIGKSIAKSCKGLPLAIAVIGGLLFKSNMTREYWEFVAKDVNSFANSANEGHCLKILSLSYDNLPIHLKPCLLFLRKFPEDYKIEVSELIRLWVAEGFLKPIKDKTLEEVAQGYLKDLTERNLILIHEWTSRGRMKYCGIHDLLRDLCIRESRKEHFYCVPKIQKIGPSLEECFLCASKDALTTIYLPQVAVASQPTSLASRLVCENCINMYPQLHRLRLVKVLESDKWSHGKGILHPNKLRSLTLKPGDYNFVDNSIHLLWNLQTIIIYAWVNVRLPSEIWELPQLRHLVISYLPNPPLNTQVDRKDSIIILKNLQTLFGIKNFKLSKDAIKRLPNLKKLSIRYYDCSVIELSHFSLHNLGLLHKLESLRFKAEDLHSLKDITFPHGLKKLHLRRSNIPWEEMTVISSLPNLEVLELVKSAFEGPEWNPVEGGFLRLKILVISKNYLVRWGAEKVHFPNLEHLTLNCMRRLEKVPSGIGEIETLRSIRLRLCPESAVNSAKEILEEQHSFGNEDLQLYVDNELVLPDRG